MAERTGYMIVIDIEREREPPPRGVDDDVTALLSSVDALVLLHARTRDSRVDFAEIVLSPQSCADWLVIFSTFRRGVDKPDPTMLYHRI